MTKYEAPASPKDAALRLALEALKHGGCPPDCKDGMTDSGGVHPWGEAALIPCPNCKTIAACEKALAQPEPEETVTITRKEYEAMLDSQRWVDCLEAAGVDNWEGYEVAVDYYQGVEE